MGFLRAFPDRADLADPVDLMGPLDQMDLMDLMGPADRLGWWKK
jgi:hypothetical protein